MSKTLIIAEKPSVAADIAKALGGFKKVPEGNEHYYESKDYVLSSAVGHLVELCLPGELDKKNGKWSYGTVINVFASNGKKLTLQPNKPAPFLKMLHEQAPQAEYLF